MPRPQLRVARAHEVTISRQSTGAEIAFRDGSVGSTRLELGPGVASMTDAEILEAFNDVVRAMERSRAEYHHVAVEIPEGSPQIQYGELYEHWVVRGDVLRCYIDDGGRNREALIEIDDQVLTMHEFGRLLMTFAGWGMRIVFVPDDRLMELPDIEIREPEESP